MSTNSFYKDLPSFSNFHGITNDRHFHTVPDDWWVFVTDVKGSTQAIQDGKYKDVNTVGAAAIASVQNAVGNLEFPFVFGGDGATLLVPPSVKEKVEEALANLQSLSVKTFKLHLRVGCVSMKELKSEGAKIKVGKYQLAGKKCVAIFRGGGVSGAEALVKGDPQKYQIGGDGGGSPSLVGLTCRWKPINSKNGRILSLLVVCNTTRQEETFQQILRKLEEILNGRMESANPVFVPDMAYRPYWKSLADELRYQKRVFSFSVFYKMFTLAFAVLFFKFKSLYKFFGVDKYTQSIAAHSDYRKFDDALRMIIDCNKNQIMQIREYLASLHSRGDIFYGTFESTTALMTCYVQGLDEGEHIHFIDGGDGGYAMAAKQLKQQMKQSKKSAEAA